MILPLDYQKEVMRIEKSFGPRRSCPIAKEVMRATYRISQKVPTRRTDAGTTYANTITADNSRREDTG